MGFTDHYGGNFFNIKSVCPVVACYVLKPLDTKQMAYDLGLLMLWTAQLWRHDFKMFLCLGDLPKCSSILSLGTLSWRPLSLYQQMNIKGWQAQALHYHGLCVAGKALKPQQQLFHRKPQKLSIAGVYIPKVWFFNGKKDTQKISVEKNRFSLPRHMHQHIQRFSKSPQHEPACWIF